MLQKTLSRNTSSSHEVVYNRSHQLSTIASANVTQHHMEKTDDQLELAAELQETFGCNNNLQHQD